LCITTIILVKQCGLMFGCHVYLQIIMVATGGLTVCVSRWWEG
jgi:hypothetical protein